MNLGLILANLFNGAGAGIGTYNEMKNYQDEKAYTRHRQGLEDADRAQYLALAQSKEANDERQRSLENRRFDQSSALKALTDAGIVGGTPQMLDANRDGNQVQTGTGAGTGAQNLLPNAMQALGTAVNAPGYDPRKGADLGNGLRFQGPDFGKADPEHYTPVYGADNAVGAFNNAEGTVKRTGFIGRAPVGTDINNPRRYVVEHTPAGDFVTDKLHPELGRQIVDPTTGQQAQGSMTIPSNPERDAAAMLGPMQARLKDLTEYYSKNGYQPPSIPVQEVMRHGGSIGNAIIGKLHPEYQKLYAQQSAAVNALLYLKSGKVITDNEYKRMRAYLEPGAGDNPESIKTKLQMFGQELDALGIRAGRAQGQIAAPAAASTNQKADEWDALVASGVDPEEATRQITAKYQGK